MRESHAPAPAYLGPSLAAIKKEYSRRTFKAPGDVDEDLLERWSGNVGLEEELPIAINGLPVMNEYWCPVCPNYAVPTEDTARKHMTKKHPRTGLWIDGQALAEPSIVLVPAGQMAARCVPVKESPFGKSTASSRSESDKIVISSMSVDHPEGMSIHHRAPAVYKAYQHR